MLHVLCVLLDVITLRMLGDVFKSLTTAHMFTNTDLSIVLPHTHKPIETSLPIWYFPNIILCIFFI
jgi:hypothetical protein